MSILIAALALAFLIVVHEWGHFIVARLCGMRVERFSVGFGNPLWSFKRGETVYQIAPIPLGGFVHITGLNPNEEFDRNDPRVYPNRPKWMQLAVLIAGPFMNYLTAIVVAFVIFVSFGAAGEKLKVDDVKPNMPAAAAGLQAGDRLLEANGKTVSTTAPINTVIRESKGAPVSVKVQRGSETKTFTMTPKQEGDNYLIGIQIGPVLEPVPLREATVQAVAFPYTASKAMLKSIWEMIAGKQKANLAGPVAITREMARAADRGMLDFLQLVTMLSVYLGLFNLLPVPALDGGRALFVIGRGLRIAPISDKAETRIHTVGFVMLIGLFLVVTANDLLGVLRDAVTHFRG